MTRLSPAQRRHLIELLDAPYWHPANSGEWSTARALERLGYLHCNVTRGMQPYSLSGAGRAVGMALLEDAE